MELSFAAATDVGRQRNHNEDNFLIDKKLRLFMVADGMGGHAAGEVASSIAVHEIRDAMNNNRDLIDRYRVDHPGVQAYEILQVLEHAVQAACGAVHQARAGRARQARHGHDRDACCSSPARGDHLRGFIAHVGDSRVYLARQNQCHVLTEDHSLMNELVRRGKLNREQIESSPYKQYKNAVTRAVGVYGSVEVDTFDFDILPGDRFLLCSDGMYAYVDEDELPKQLADGDVKDVPKKLVDVANKGGGHDNITAVVIRVGDDRGTERTAHAPRSRSSSRCSRACRCSATSRTRSWSRSRRSPRSVELKTGPDHLRGGPARRRDVRRDRRAACGSSRTTSRSPSSARPALRRDGARRSLDALADRDRDRRHAPRRDPPQGLLRHHQARARERREDAVERSSRCSASACARPPTISPTRSTATSTAQRPSTRTCFRTELLGEVRLPLVERRVRCEIGEPLLGARRHTSWGGYIERNCSS